MNRRSLLINASRPIVHNGVTLPDLPTGVTPAAVIWNSRTGSYVCIESQTTPYNISYSQSTLISIWIGSYQDTVYYYTLVSPYETWSERKSTGYSGYVTGGTNYGIYYTLFSCYDIDHVIYANRKVYDRAINSTATWLRDADTLTFDEKNGSFSKREYTWEIIGTTLHIYDDSAMADCTAATEQPWYASRGDITAVEIHDGVTKIGDRAFQHFTAITSIDIPSGVLTIGGHSLQFCSALTTVTIADTVVSIGDATFDSDTSLTSINIPSGVTLISAYLLYGCTSLASITYDGTSRQWNALTKGTSWNSNTGNFRMNFLGGLGLPELPTTAPHFLVFYNINSNRYVYVYTNEADADFSVSLSNGIISVWVNSSQATVYFCRLNSPYSTWEAPVLAAVSSDSSHGDFGAYATTFGVCPIDGLYYTTDNIYDTASHSFANVIYEAYEETFDEKNG